MTSNDPYEQAVINAAHSLRNLLKFEDMAKPGVRFILLELYRLMVNKGLCVRIQDLPHEEKLALWEESKKIMVECGKRKAVATAIHSLGNFIQL